MSMRHLLWILASAMMTTVASSPLLAQEATEQQATPSTDAGTIQGFPYAAWSVTATSFNNPLGFDVAAVDGALRAQLELPEGGGVVVTNIMPDSDAAKAGLQQHDVLIKVDDKLITSPEMLHELVAGAPGKKITLNLVRRGNLLVIEFTLPQAVTYEWTNLPYAFKQPQNQFRIGVTLAQADDTLRTQLRLAADEGLVVTEVVADGPAAKAGIQQHDVLTKLDDRGLSTVENLEAQIQEIKDRSVTLNFLRGGHEMSCTLAPQLSNDVEVTFQKRDLAEWWVTDAREVHLYNWQQGQRAAISWQPYVVESTAQEPAPESEKTVASQLAELKQQLATMQKSLEALEAAIQAAAQPKE